MNATGEMDREGLSKMHEGYKAGKVARDEYAMYLIGLLDNYIAHIITTMHRTMGADREDLMQQGRLAIIEQMDEYDPSRSSPTTYFTSYIKDATRKICDSKPLMTRHFVKRMAKLDKAAKEAGYSGHEDPRLTAGDLAKLTGFTEEAVREAIDRSKVSMESLSDLNDDVPCSTGISQDPAKIFIRKEERACLRAQAEKMSPLEKYVFAYLADGDFAGLCRLYAEDEGFSEAFSDELAGKKVDQAFFRRLHNGAMRRIRNSVETREMFPGRDADYDLMPQASACGGRAVYAL